MLGKIPLVLPAAGNAASAYPPVVPADTRQRQTNSTTLQVMLIPPLFAIRPILPSLSLSPVIHLSLSLSLYRTSSATRLAAMAAACTAASLCTVSAASA
jgi:hypothetical protein